MTTKTRIVGLLLTALLLAVALGIGVFDRETVPAFSENAEKLPQSQSGDGWRLLLDDTIGRPYVVHVVTTEDELVLLWQELGPMSFPSVSFDSEVVLYFGAVQSAWCPGVLFDDLVVDLDLGLVHGQFSSSRPGQVDVCPADAQPHAFVIAVDRAILPKSPFTLRLFHPSRPRPEPVTVDLRVTD